MSSLRRGRAHPKLRVANVVQVVHVHDDVSIQNAPDPPPEESPWRLSVWPKAALDAESPHLMVHEVAITQELTRSRDTAREREDRLEQSLGRHPFGPRWVVVSPIVHRHGRIELGGVQ